MNRKVIKIISAALLAYFVIMTATAVFGSMVDDGVILDAWFSMIQVIPFGNVLAELCVNLFADSFNLGNNLGEYLVGIQSLTLLDAFEDTATLMLTAAIFEAMDNFLKEALDVKGKKGFYAIIMRMICSMISSLLCTFIASILLHYLCQQMVMIPNVVREIISFVVSTIIVSGAVGILYFVLGAGIVSALIYVVVKIVLVNVCKVVFTYSGILLILLFLGEKAYFKVFSVFAGWGIVIIMLIGLDIMISIVFDH